MYMHNGTTTARAALALCVRRRPGRIALHGQLASSVLDHDVMMLQWSDGKLQTAQRVRGWVFMCNPAPDGKSSATQGGRVKGTRSLTSLTWRFRPVLLAAWCGRSNLLAFQLYKSKQPEKTARRCSLDPDRRTGT